MTDDEVLQFATEIVAEMITSWPYGTTLREVLLQRAAKGDKRAVAALVFEYPTPGFLDKQWALPSRREPEAAQ